MSAPVATSFALNGLVVVPLGFALAAALLSRRDRVAVGVAVLGSVVTLGWSVWAAWSVSGWSSDGTGGALGDSRTTVDLVWLAALDVHWRLGLDGISAPLVLMSTLVFALCLASLLRHAPSPR